MTPENHSWGQVRNSTTSRSPSPTTSLSTPPTAHSSSPLEDDIWGTPPHQLDLSDEPGLQSSIPSDVPRLRVTHNTAGYRDGIAAARDSAVQPGFDEGYLLGAAVGIRAGYLLGVLEGLTAGALGETPGQSDGSAELVGQDVLQKELHEDLGTITNELTLENLLGKEYVTEDGIWNWSVDSGTEEATIHDVANCHPILVKWSERIDGLLERANMKRGDGMDPRSGAGQ